MTIPRWLILVVCLVVLLLFIVWFFTRAPWLKVKDVRIQGTATEETKAEVEKLRGQNILWLSVTRPEAAILAKQPALKHIQILRGIPDTLIVKLIERQPAMIWQAGDHWYTADSSGFIYADKPLAVKADGSFEFPGTDLPVVVDTKNLPAKIGQTVVRPQFVTFVRGLRDRLPKEANAKLIRAEIGETSFNVTAVTDAGWNILFDTTRSLDAQFKTLTKVLVSKRGEVHQYVDVRVRGWVYYK